MIANDNGSESYYSWSSRHYDENDLPIDVLQNHVLCRSICEEILHHCPITRDESFICVPLNTDKPSYFI